MKNSQNIPAQRPVAIPTTTIVTVDGRQCDGRAQRLCRLSDGTISTTEGYFSYDRQQESHYYQKG